MAYFNLIQMTYGDTLSHPDDLAKISDISSRWVICSPLLLTWINFNPNMDK